MAKYQTTKPVSYRGTMYDRGDFIDNIPQSDADELMRKGIIHKNRVTKEDKAAYASNNKAYAVQHGAWYHIKREGETLEKVQGKKKRDEKLAEYNG